MSFMLVVTLCLIKKNTVTVVICELYLNSGQNVFDSKHTVKTVVIRELD